MEEGRGQDNRRRGWEGKATMKGCYWKWVGYEPILIPALGVALGLGTRLNSVLVPNYRYNIDIKHSLVPRPLPDFISQLWR